MTIDFEQVEHDVVDAGAMAKKLAELGSMEAVQDSGAFDELMGQIDRGEIQLDGKEGFIQQIIRAGLERGLNAELTEHLGYEKHDAQGRGSGNSRNGHYPKTVSTIGGDIEVSMPRDRAGTFVPTLVPKGSRRTGGLDEMIISLYAESRHLLQITPSPTCRSDSAQDIQRGPTIVPRWHTKSLRPQSKN